MDFEVVQNEDELRRLYGMPLDISIKKQGSCIDQFSSQFLSLSPFIIISTCGANGLLDASPRGEQPGFIKVLDDKTIAIPDRPGNNRLDSLTNIVENPQIGILSLIPGFKECLRINGSAKIVTNKELLEQFSHSGKTPVSVIVVTIEEIYFHCSKAIARAKLWDTSAQTPRNEMPSFGRILMFQIDPETTETKIKEAEEFIEHRARTTLY